MAHTFTHTLATLEVSEKTYRDIKRRLKKAGGQEDRFIELSGRDALDMNGIGLVLKARPKRKRSR